MAIAQILMSIIQTNKVTDRRFAFKILCDIKFILLYQSMRTLSGLSHADITGNPQYFITWFSSGYDLH